MNFDAHAVQRARSRARDNSTRFPDASAFTLAEMLIVIGIAALLMAILLPSISRVREQANLALCQNNMKKLYDVFSLLGAEQGKSPIDIPTADDWIAFVEKQNCMANLVCPVDEKREGKSTGDPGSGIIRFLSSPPASAEFNHGNESNSQLVCFREQSGLVLPQAVRVNMTPGGGAGTVPAGTSVACFFMMLDPVGHSSATVSGSVAFSGEILGVICEKPTLDETDSILGAPGTTYPAYEQWRGIEEAYTKLYLSPDKQTLIINNLHAHAIGEQIRVLVSEGGMASYAMNKWAGGTWGRSDQILLLEYNKAVASLEYGSKPPDDLAYWLAPRHRRKLSVLYNHGGFEVLTASELIKRTKSPIDKDFAAEWRR